MKPKGATFSKDSCDHGVDESLNQASQHGAAAVATFRLAEQRFAVVPAPERENAPRSRTNPRDRHGMDIAGEIWLDDRLHYIISAPDETSEGEPSNLPHVLTRREIQIIMLVAEGCVNKQIADRLRISEWTVSTHMRRIFAKLGVDSRAAMVFHCAKRLGLSSGS